MQQIHEIAVPLYLARVRGGSGHLAIPAAPPFRVRERKQVRPATILPKIPRVRFAAIIPLCAKTWHGGFGRGGRWNPA